MARIPEYRAYKAPIWRGLWYPARVLAAVFWRYRVEFEAPVPDGPLVVAANHLSHLDPPFVGLAVRRPVRFLALDELWSENAGFAAVLGFFGSIPLPRAGRVPIAALRESLRHLDAGGAVGLYPEARRVRAWGDEPPRRGAAWLSVRTGAPLLPVAVWGTQHAMPIDRLRLRPARVTVVVGAPIRPDAFARDADPVGAMTEAWRLWVDATMRTVAG